MTFPPFRPLPMLRGAHRQTLAGWVAGDAKDLPGSQSQTIPLGSGDATTLLCHEPEDSRPDSPTLVLIHGLEGRADRPYMNRLARKAAATGMKTARMNMRWCGNAEGLSSRYYNSTDSGDVRAVCEYLRAENQRSPIGIIGFSLGGNLALKMAAEGGTEGLFGVVAISPPIDLHASAGAIARNANRPYHYYLIKSMAERGARFLESRGLEIDVPLTPKMSIMDFDTHFTVPLGGFDSLKHYYDEGSPKRVLHKMETPTLLIAARDDPIVPFESFEGLEDLSNGIDLLTPRCGGHLGFVGRGAPTDGDYRWAENRALEFIRNSLPKDGNA